MLKKLKLLVAEMDDIIENNGNAEKCNELYWEAVSVASELKAKGCKADLVNEILDNVEDPMNINL